MASRITPRFIELTYEAALKSFWRSEALRKFLRACQIADSFLSTWSPEESKRDLLDKIFEKLTVSDRGKAVIFEMARALSEQTQAFLIFATGKIRHKRLPMRQRL